MLAHPRRRARGCASRFSPVKRGMVRAEVVGREVVGRVIAPASNPGRSGCTARCRRRARAPSARSPARSSRVQQRPLALQRGDRVHRAAPRAASPALTSDSPRCRPCPPAPARAIAPTVSSIGTSRVDAMHGSRGRCGRRRGGAATRRTPGGRTRGGCRSSAGRRRRAGCRTWSRATTSSRRPAIARPTSSSLCADAVHVGGVEEGDRRGRARGGSSRSTRPRRWRRRTRTCPCSRGRGRRRPGL